MNNENKRVANSLFFLALALIVSVPFFNGCSKSSVKAIVSVTENFSEGTASALNENGLDPQRLEVAGIRIGDNERISFTPSSMKIRVKGVYLCPNMVYSQQAGGLTCSSDTEINVTSEPKEVDLIGQEAFSELLTFNAEVESALFGDYRGVLLLYGEDRPMGEYGYSELTVSGSVNIGGTPYTFTDLKVPMGTSGIGLNMPVPVTIDADHEAIVKVLFDVDNAAFLMNNPTSPQSAKIPGTDVGVVIDNLPFLPFTGAENPVVEKYRVVLTSGVFGSPDKWYLKVVTFLDASRNLVAVGWQTVYLPGYTSSGEWEPGMPYVPVITKIDETTYSIKEEPENSFTPAERRIEFPAFKLETHSGTLIYGGNKYNYTATRQ